MRRAAWVFGPIAIVALAVGIVLLSTGVVVSRTASSPLPPPVGPATLPSSVTKLWGNLTALTSGPGPLAGVSTATAWPVSLAGGTAVVATWQSGKDFETDGTDRVLDRADALVGLNASTGALRWSWGRKHWELAASAASVEDGEAVALWVVPPSTTSTSAASRSTDQAGSTDLRETNQLSRFGEVGKDRVSYVLTALDLRTGRLDWMKKGIGTGRVGGAVTFAGPDVVALAGSTLSAYQASGGRQLWQHGAPTGCDWLFPGGKLATGGTAVVPFRCDNGRSGGVARLAPATGATIWQHRLPGLPAALDVEGGVVAVTMKGQVQVFDERTGRLDWKRAIPRDTSAVVGPRSALPSGFVAVDAAGNAYLPEARDRSTELVSVAADGHVRWRFTLPKSYELQTVDVFGGRVVVGGSMDDDHSRGLVELFAAATGKRSGQVTTDVTYDGVVALAPGFAVLADRDGGDLEIAAYSIPQLGRAG